MALPSALAIYFIIWWIGLFAVLPWGVRSQHEAGEVIPGSEPGAPASIRVLRVVIANTIFATLVFTLFYLNYVNHWIKLDDIPFLPRYQTHMPGTGP